MAAAAGRWLLAGAVALLLAGCGDEGDGFGGVALPETTQFRTTLVEVVTTTAPPPTTAAPPTSAGQGAAPQATVAAASGGYVVQPGDAWYLIASELGVDVQRLLQANGATLQTSIFPGQTLAVPGAAPAPGGATAGTSTSGPTTSAAAGVEGEYVVQPGDAWYLIASKLGVDVQRLLQANGATLQTSIFPGQKLVVPSP